MSSVAGVSTAVNATVATCSLFVSAGSPRRIRRRASGWRWGDPGIDQKACEVFGSDERCLQTSMRWRLWRWWWWLMEMMMFDGLCADADAECFAAADGSV